MEKGESSFNREIKNTTHKKFNMNTISLRLYFIYIEPAETGKGIKQKF